MPDRFLKALQTRNEEEMKACIDANFDGRRTIWGDDALGGETGPNLRMISVGTGRGSEA